MARVYIQSEKMCMQQTDYFVLGTYVCDRLVDPKCVGGSSVFTRAFKKGKTYLLRLINASTESTFIFTIDNHMLEVISRLVDAHASGILKAPFPT
jgi:FtsP/CotA-like multicopper oxidase with cupredoxin domain